MASLISHVRTYHLEIIEQGAAAENGRGLRASAWILERLFPGDYAPKMAERFAYLHLQDKLQDREESALVHEDVQIRLAEEKAPPGASRGRGGGSSVGRGART